MKTLFLTIIFVINLIPGTSAGPTACVEEWSSCFNSELDLQVGNQYNWTVIENLEDGEPYDYGVDSDKPLIISLTITKDFRGMEERDFERNWTKYLEVRTTVDNENVSGWSDTIDYMPAAQIISGTLQYQRLIRTTYIIVNNSTSNKFRYLAEVYPEMTRNETYLGTAEITIMFFVTQSINNEIHTFSERVVVTDREDDSKLLQTSHAEVKTDIRTGIVLQIRYDFRDLTVDRTKNVLIHYQDFSLPVSTKLALGRFGLSRILIVITPIFIITSIIILGRRNRS